MPIQNFFYKFVVSASLALLSFSALANEDAMFGLKWNMSPAHLRAAGVVLEHVENDTPGVGLFLTKSLPQNLSPADNYTLIFVDDRLVSVIMSRPVVNDASGRIGKQQYAELATALREKYGPATEVQEKMPEDKKDGSQFYTCLKKKSGCLWQSFFKKQDKWIRLILQGGYRPDQGVLELRVSSPQRDMLIKKKYDEASKLNTKAL